MGYVAGENGQLRFEELPAPTDDDIQDLLERLVHRIHRLARRALDDNEQPDWVDEEQQSVLNCTGEGLRLPSAPNRGPRRCVLDSPAFHYTPAGASRPKRAPALDANTPDHDLSSESAKPNKKPGWAQLLKRVLDIDALCCPACATAMLVVL